MVDLDLGLDQAVLAVDLNQVVMAAAHQEAAHQEAAHQEAAQEELVHPSAMMEGLEVILKLHKYLLQFIVNLDVDQSRR